MTTVGQLAVVAGCTAVIYAFLIGSMRLVSRRQLGQLTAIDMVVILVLGSAVETGMIHGNTTIPAAITSVATLMGMNRALTAIFLRSKRFAHLVNGGPILLVHEGDVVFEHLRRAGMTQADLIEGVRSKGYAGIYGLYAVILETDGTLSVIDHAPAPPKPAAQKATKAGAKTGAAKRAKPATKAATKPASKTVTKPATKAATKPARKPASKTVTTPATKPAKKTVKKVNPAK